MEARERFNGSEATKGISECLYEVLDSKPSDNLSSIRKKYMRIARSCHPDKQRFVCDESEASDKSRELFIAVSHAYGILSDPAQREAYDMLHGHKQMEKGCSSLEKMKQEQAQHEVDMMRVSFDIIRCRELSCGGLVIDDAVYGDRDVVESSKLEDLSGRTDSVINVTRQLQCAVEKSKLIFPAGEPKHNLLPGVYDPAYGRDKLLWVRYYFRGKLHRAMFGDDQRALLPLRSHCVSGDGSKKHRDMEARKKKKQRNLSNASQNISKRHTIPPIYWIASITAATVVFSSFISVFWWLNTPRGITSLFSSQKKPLWSSKLLHVNKQNKL